jgi:hypothetical protein
MNTNTQYAGRRFPIYNNEEDHYDDDYQPLRFSPTEKMKFWESETRWDGNNTVFIHGGQCGEETLFFTGRRWVVLWTPGGPRGTTWAGGSDAYAKVISPREAAHWLVKNGDELPVELEKLENIDA